MWNGRRVIIYEYFVDKFSIKVVGKFIWGGGGVFFGRRVRIKGDK